MQFPSEAVQRQVARILASEDFKHARQLQHFLTYIVECASQGKEDQLSAYSVATNALGRGKDFAPDEDPIVRVLASKLRRRLELYNRGIGVDDSIHISLPKGGYAPLIEENRLDGKIETQDDADTSVTDGVPGSDITPVILVKFFETDSNQFSSEFAEDVYSELVSSLSRFDLIRVFPLHGSEQSPDFLAYKSNIEGSIYCLSGSCRITEGIAHVRVFLRDDRSGINIWSNNFDVDAAQPNAPSTCLPLVAEVAPVLAEISGIVFTDLQSKNNASGVNQNNAIGLIVSSYRFSNQPDEAGFIVAQAAVQRAAEIAPFSAYAWSRLSTVLLDGYYFGFGGLSQSESMLALAYKYALKSKELAPQSSTSNLAYSNALFGLGYFEEAVEAGEYAISLNPLNIDLAAEHGYRRAIKGGWIEGLKLIEEAKKKRPNIPARRVFAELCFLYLNEKYAEALKISKRVDFPEFYIYRAILACLHFKTENKDEAQREMVYLLKLRPNFSLDELQNIMQRYTTKELASMVTECLKQGGYEQIVQ